MRKASFVEQSFHFRTQPSANPRLGHADGIGGDPQVRCHIGGRPPLHHRLPKCLPGIGFEIRPHQLGRLPQQMVSFLSPFLNRFVAGIRIFVGRLRRDRQLRFGAAAGAGLATLTAVMVPGSVESDRFEPPPETVARSFAAKLIQPRRNRGKDFLRNITRVLRFQSRPPAPAVHQRAVKADQPIPA